MAPGSGWSEMMENSGQREIGAFTVDESLTIRVWDPWMARATAIPSEAAHGRRVEEVLPGLEVRGFCPLLRQVVAEGTIHVLSAALHRYLIPCAPRQPSAHFAHMQQHVTIGPLRKGDRILGAIVTVEDVTERREQELERAAGGKRAVGPDEDRAVRAALREADWRARRRGTGSLAASPTPDDLVPSLVSALREEHHDFSVVSSALQLLAQIHLDVVDPLVDLLDSPSADLRIQAALALGEQGDGRAIPALLRALEDADANVRFHAIEALGKLRAAEGVLPLVRIAEARDFFLAFAALDALARIGDPAAAPHLVPLLQDEMLRASAVDALGKLGDEGDVASLAALLDAPDAPVEAIAQAIVSLHGRTIRNFGEGQVIVDLVRRHATRTGVARAAAAARTARGEALRSLAIVLGWLDGEDVPATLAQLLGHHDVRREVVEALVRFGPRVTDLLVDQLRSEDAEARRAAVVALGQIGDRRATPALLDLMARDRALVVSAAGALARNGDPAAFDRLLPFLSDPETAVRQATIAAINSIGHPDTAARILPMLDAGDARARESAVRIAGYFGYPEAVNGILRACHDDHQDVRRAALEHLPFIDDERSLPVLLNALATETGRVRAVAAQALGRLETPAAVTGLIAALGDQEPWVRYFAARSLGHHRAVVAVTTLAELTRSDPAMPVRLSAIEALGLIGGPEAVAVLVPLAKAPGDLGLAALRALGEVRDEAAWPPLREALTSADSAVQAEAVRAIARRDGGAAAPELEWIAAASPDPGVVQEAMNGLGRLGTTATSGDDVAGIEALVRLTSEPLLRDAAVCRLGKLPREKAAILAGGLSNPKPEVRAAVVEALGCMHDERATVLLRNGLDDPSPRVRRTAVAALGHLGSRGAASRLATLARNDPDPAVRATAQAVLGRAAGTGERAADTGVNAPKGE